MKFAEMPTKCRQVKNVGGETTPTPPLISSFMFSEINTTSSAKRVGYSGVPHLFLFLSLPLKPSKYLV